MTQKTTLPLTFTGTGSTLPKFIPSLAVTAGLIRRYTTESLDIAAVGQPVTSLPDLAIGAQGFANGTVAGQPKLRFVNGLRYLEFDGVDDQLTGGNVGSGVKTAVAVLRFRSASAPAGNNWPAIALANGGNSSYSLNASGSMTAYVSSVLNGSGAPGSGLHVFMAVFNGANSAVRVDDTEVLGNLGNAASGASYNLGTGSAGGSFVPLDLAELGLWDRALTKEERDAVVTDLRAKYGI